MSYTQSIGVVGVEYWSYMAITMATCLGRIISGGMHVLSINVLLDAQKFFDVVLGKETGDTMFDNPPAQQHAHSLAWEILNNCDELRSKTKERADDYFQKFAALLNKLGKEVRRPLNPEELKTAEELQGFFLALYALYQFEDTRV